MHIYINRYTNIQPKISRSSLRKIDLFEHRSKIALKTLESRSKPTCETLVWVVRSCVSQRSLQFHYVNLNFFCVNLSTSM